MNGIHESLSSLAVPLDRLSRLPGNPRRGDVDAVARSYEMFGQRKPVVATADGTVIAGNHQLDAAERLGWDALAVVFVDDDDLKARAFALADNRTSELGGYDDDALAAMLAEVADDADLFAATSFSQDDLDALLASLDDAVEPAGFTDPDAIPDPPAPTTQPGDLWLLGPHRLLCGDATDAADVEQVMAGDRAAMVWTDPPYGVEYVGKTVDALTIRGDSVVGLDVLLAAAFGLAAAACVPGAVWFVAGAPGPPWLTFATALDRLGIWHQTLIWVKDRFVMSYADYHGRFETLFYGWTPGAAHHPVPDRTQDTVWEFDRPPRSTDHPTMKPVALIERAITNHTDSGAIILDPFGGSGSTLIAAHRLDRRARLVELEPKYVDVICRRYQEHTGDIPVLEATGEPHDFTLPAHP